MAEREVPDKCEFSSKKHSSLSGFRAAGKAAIDIRAIRSAIFDCFEKSDLSVTQLH
jgi:hypothetical protein